MFGQKRNSLGEVERRRKKDGLLVDSRKVPRSANASPSLKGYHSHSNSQHNQVGSRPNTASLHGHKNTGTAKQRPKTTTKGYESNNTATTTAATTIPSKKDSKVAKSLGEESIRRAMKKSHTKSKANTRPQSGKKHH